VQQHSRQNSRSASPTKKGREGRNSAVTKPNLNKFLTHPESELGEPVSATAGFDRSLTGDDRAMMLDVMETLKVES
jgi:hypothetical protein